MRSEKPYLVPLLVTVLVMTLMSCTLVEVARDALGRLPTATASSTPVSGTDHWYIATDGTNGGPCSETQPCQTLRHVLGRVTDNDAVHIGPGTFIEPGLSASILVSWGVSNKRLTIEGDGVDRTILDSEGRRVGFRFSGSGSATLRNLTVRNSGGEFGFGRCLWIEDRISVVLEDVNIEDCEYAGIRHDGTTGLVLRNANVRRVVENERGGQNAALIYSRAPLVIEGGEFTNSARHGITTAARLQMSGSRLARTGAQAIQMGEGTLENVTVREPGPSPFGGSVNYPVGIEIHPGAGPVELINVDVSDYGRCVSVNQRANPTVRNSDLSGCAITGLWVEAGASATVESSDINFNGRGRPGSAHAGGVFNDGTLTVNESVIADNHGFGLTNWGNLTLYSSWVNENVDNDGLVNRGTSVISGSTISGANAPYAGVLNYGQMTLVNSTVSSNEKFGVQAITGNLILRHVTIADNGEEGLVARDASSKIELIDNTLLAGNGPRGDCAFFGDFSVPALAGVNLSSDDTCSFANTNSRLRLTMDDLADNGGVSPTHGLHTDSAAVDAISGACTSVDQRGATRPKGTGCDVGAFELDPLFLRAPISGEGTPTAPVTVTPSSSTSLPRVIEESLCWRGPGPQYEVISALEVESTVEILGRAVEGDWWVIDNPRFPGVRCWAPGDSIQVDPGFSYPSTLFEIPPLPTPTPTPLQGCLFQPQNENNPVCYPIDQCPVDFDDSLGACTP